MTSAPSIPAAAAGLWDKALASLPADLKKGLETVKTPKSQIVEAVLQEVEAQKTKVFNKRLRFKKPNGSEVIVRDLLEKIAGWVHRFKEVGDTIVQYDPAHAALPWAAVRFLLQTSISEIEVFGALVDELEEIARMMARYRIFENLYLRGESSETEQGLEAALVRLYAEILTRLGYAIKLFQEKILVRVALSPFRSADPDRAKRMANLEAEINKYARLSDTATLRDVERAFTRLSAQTLQSTSKERFTDIYEWLAVAPYSNHHQFVVDLRLPGAGQWLLEHKAYLEWQTSSSSALFLLHGIPGSGKSTLCSVVVESFLAMAETDSRAAPLGYFYCSTLESEMQRQSSDDVMRTILYQLAVNTALPTKMREFLCSEYERQAHRSTTGKAGMFKLRTADCVRLILELATQDPITIIVDSLDSIVERERPDFILALREIIDKADNVVKIFITSRTSRAAMMPQAEHEVQISSQNTRMDMESYVNHLIDTAVAKKLLLNGNLPPQTGSELKRVVLQGAGEMFLWAKLQVDRICREHVEADVLTALEDKVPQDIDQLFRESLNHIDLMGDVGQGIAVKVISWLLYMREPLTPAALLATLAEANHPPPELTQVIAICANLVILDTTCNMMRFIHQSVQEFLSSQPRYAAGTAHTFLASACLDACSRGPTAVFDDTFRIPNDDFYVYAAIYWPVHLQMARKLCQDNAALGALMEDVRSFIFEDDWEVNFSFECWNSDVQDLVPHFTRDHTMRPLLDAIPSTDGFLFLFAIFGYEDMLESALAAIDSIDVNQKNKHSQSPIYLAARHGHLATMLKLFDHGANVNVDGGKLGSPLHAACFQGHMSIVEDLLRHGADVSCGTVYNNALEAAFLGGKEDVALRLLDVESMIQSEAAYEVAMDYAARSGFARVVQQLQLPRFADFSRPTDDKMMKRVRSLIKSGNLMAVRRFLGQKQSERSLPPDCVAVAVEGGHEDLIKFLLAEGANIEEEGLYGSPLRTAALLNYNRLAQLLLHDGAGVNAVGRHGDALQTASWKGHIAMMELLIRHGANVNQKSGFWGTSLQAAAYHGQLRAVELLLTSNADVHEKGYSRDAFHAAVEGGHEDVVMLMLHRGYAPYRHMGFVFDSVPEALISEKLLRDAFPERYTSSKEHPPAAGDSAKMESGQVASFPEGTVVNAVASEEQQSFDASGTAGLPILGYRSEDYTGEESFPIEAAASAGRQEVVETLVKYQRVLGIFATHMIEAIKEAAENGHVSVVRFLFDHLYSRQPAEPLIETILLAAKRNEQHEVLEYALQLVEKHCAVDERVRLNALTIPTAAAATAAAATAAAATTKDSNSKPDRKRLLSDFTISCRTGNSRLATSILETEDHMLLSDARIEHGLRLCAVHGHHGLIQLLLHSPCLQTRMPSICEEMFVTAAASGHLALMKLLVSFWPKVAESPDSVPLRRALVNASEQGRIEAVRYLVVELQADVNLCSPDEALRKMAFSSNSPDSDSSESSVELEELGNEPSDLESDIFPVSRRYYDRGEQREDVSFISPLQASLRGFARFNGSMRQYKSASRGQLRQAAVTQLLLEVGSDPNALGGQTLFPIQYAAKHCPTSIIGNLIRSGVDINKFSNADAHSKPRERRYYVVTSKSGDHSGSRQRTAWVDIQGVLEWTKPALFIAAERPLSALPIVRQLLEAGATAPEDVELQHSLVENVLKEFEDAVPGFKYVRSYHPGEISERARDWIEAAFSVGSISAIPHLMSQMPHITAKTDRWNLVLQIAAFLHKTDFIDQLLSFGPDINATGYQFGTVLQAAASQGHERLVSKLLDAGAEVNSIGGDYHTALRAAVSGGHESTVRVLLDRGASLEPEKPQRKSEVRRKTVLRLGVEVGSLAIVRMLLARGASPMLEKSDKFEHPLTVAADKGFIDIAKELIDAGAPVNVKFSSGFHSSLDDFYCEGHFLDEDSFTDASPLHAASARGNLEMVKLLVSNGAMVEGPNDSWRSPLMVAASNGKADVVVYLLQAGARCDNNSSLTRAVVKEDVGLVKALLSAGAKVEGVLAMAFRHKNLEVVELLLCDIVGRADADPIIDEAFAVANLDETVLRLLLSYAPLTVFRFARVCASAPVHLVEHILSQGLIDENQMAGEAGSRALHAAAVHLQSDVVRLLVSRGANIDGTAAHGGSPLVAALEACASPLLRNWSDQKLQLWRLADKVQKPAADEWQSRDQSHLGRGQPASYTSFLRLSNCESIVGILLGKGASVDLEGGCLGTPLHIACLVGSRSMVELLWDYGADFDAMGGFFDTTIFAAIHSRNIDVLSFCLQHTQPSTIQHLHPELGSPLHYACHIHEGSIVRMLLQHGANSSATDSKGQTPLAAALYNTGSSRFAGPLSVFMEMIDYLHISDDDLVAAATASVDTTLLQPLLSLKRNNAVPEAVICNVLSHETANPDVIKYLMENSGDIGATANILQAVTDERQLKILLEFLPVNSVSSATLASQKSLKCISLLLEAAPDVSISRDVIFRALRPNQYYSREDDLLKTLLQRSPELQVTQDMLEAVRYDEDMEILLDHLDKETKISSGVLDAISRLDSDESYYIVKRLLKFDPSIQVSQKTASRVVKRSTELSALELFLQHNPSMEVTPKMFLAVLRHSFAGSDSALADVMTKYDKRVVSTQKVRKAVARSTDERLAGLMIVGEQEDMKNMEDSED